MLPLDFLVEMLEKLAPSVHNEGKELLDATLDSKGEDRNIAQFELNNAAKIDPDQFLCFMSVVMADHKKFASVVRRGATLQLHQHLNNKDPVMLKDQQKLWKAIAADVRDMIKSNVLVAFPTISPLCPKNATEIIASIAVMEIPLKDNWPDLLPTLSYYIRHLDNEEKECAMEALAFVCTYLRTEILGEYFTHIMMVITSFHVGQLSKRLRLATLHILLACFEFVRPYFENPEERRVLMQAICEAAKSPDVDTCATGLALLVKVASTSYQHLKDYIDVIAPITLKAIRSEEKIIHLNGLEFWKAISQVENPRDTDGRLKTGTEGSQSTKSPSFVVNSLEKLVPVLFEELVRGEAFIRAEEPENSSVSSDYYASEAQPMNYDSFFKTESRIHQENTFNTEENEQNHNTLITKVKRNNQKKDEELLQNHQLADRWTPPREIIIYFSEQCQNYPEAIDRFVLPLFQREIRHVDWKHRHAALWSILVFLKQMDPLHAANSLTPIFPLIRSFLRDTSSSRIRSTALWVTSWMVEKCPLLLFNSTSQDLHQLVNDLITSLKDEEGRVSPSSCIALMSVIKAAYSVAMAQQKVEESKRPPTFLLSPYYDMMANQLVKAAKRRLTAAFDAVRLLLLNAPDDCYWVVLETTDELLLLLRKVIELPDAHHVGCRCHEAVQKLLCGVLRNVVGILKLGETSSKQLCHKFMTYLLSLLKKFPTGLARTEALMSVSTVAFLLDWELKHHLDLLVPFLITAIKSTSKKDPVLSLVVDLIGTLSLVLDSEAMPSVNKLLGPLLVLTDGNHNLPMEVKIHCVVVFGQIARAVGRPGLQIYMAAVLRRLQHCVELSTLEEKDESSSSRELKEKLRQACLDTFSSLVKSILHRGSLPLTLELCSISLCIKNIARLLRSVVTSKSKLPEKTHTATAHLIGNVLLEFGTKKALACIPLDASECKSILEYAVCQNTTNKEVQFVCQEALIEIEMAGRGLN